MAKFKNSAINFVRKIFNKEKEFLDNAVGTKDLAISASNALGYGSIDAVQMGALDEILGIDKYIINRLRDYELMDEYPDISSALDIYADDSTQVDGEKGHVLWIESEVEDIKKELENLFYKTIKVDENAWSMVRTLSKFGNDYEEIVVGENGVIGLNYMNPATVRRLESNNGALLGFAQSYDSSFHVSNNMLKDMKFKNGGAQKDGVAAFESWRVVHTRLRSKYRDAMYGWPVTEAARWVWKRLLLLEDAVMLYKLTRNPSRLAYYIDTGSLPNREAERHLEIIKNKLKKKKFINPRTGKLDTRFNPLAFDEDIFLAVREGNDKTRVDVLNGPSYQQIEDVQYFLYKLYAALKIPRAYMGYDENMPSRATLSQEDVRFGRTVLRVQNEYINGMNKVGNVHLALKNIDPNSVDFNLKMTVPSAIFELGQMEVRRARAELASMMGTNVSQYWILSNIYKLSDSEIKEVMKQKEIEAKMPGVGGGQGFESVETNEKALMEGSRADEKKAYDKLMREMEKKDSKIGKKINENAALLREIAHSVSRRH